MRAEWERIKERKGVAAGDKGVKGEKKTQILSWPWINKVYSTTVTLYTVTEKPINPNNNGIDYTGVLQN